MRLLNLSFLCPGCYRPLRYLGHHLGKLLRCPRCRAVVQAQDRPQTSAEHARPMLVPGRN